MNQPFDTVTVKPPTGALASEPAVSIGARRIRRAWVSRTGVWVRTRASMSRTGDGLP